MRKILGVLSLLLLSGVLLGAPAYALPSITSSGYITLTEDAGQIRVSLSQGNIGAVSGGIGDPLGNGHQAIFAPYGPGPQNFTLLNPTGPTTWNVSHDSNQYSVGGGLLSGDTAPRAMDWNPFQGTITWDPVAITSVNNTIGSATLAGFAGYQTGTLSILFASSGIDPAWLSNPTGSVTTTYTSILTATPEPEIWLLWTVSLGALIGWGYLRRQNPGFDPALQA